MNRRTFCGGLIGAGALALLPGPGAGAAVEPLPSGKAPKVELVYRDVNGQELSRGPLDGTAPDGWHRVHAVVTTVGDGAFSFCFRIPS